VSKSEEKKMTEAERDRCQWRRCYRAVFLSIANGPEMGRVKNEYDIDSVIPVRKNMDILEDVRGVVKLDVKWEECCSTATRN